MTKKSLYGLAAIFTVAMLMTLPAFANPVTMGFDEINTHPPIGAQYVNDFYNGGCTISGRGDPPSCTGPDYGVTWQNAFAQSPFTVSHEPSEPNVIFNHNDDIFQQVVPIVMNVDSGFNQGMAFYYSSHRSNTIIQVFSGLGGTGDLLAQVLAPPTQIGYTCTNGSGFVGLYACWNPASFGFSGIAHSAAFFALRDHLALDNVRINVLPEPSEFGMFALGILLIGGFVALRRRGAQGGTENLELSLGASVNAVHAGIVTPGRSQPAGDHGHAASIASRLAPTSKMSYFAKS